MHELFVQKQTSPGSISDTAGDRFIHSVCRMTVDEEQADWRSALLPVGVDCGAYQ